MAAIKSPCTTLYRRLIVTFALLFQLKFGGVSFGVDLSCWGLRRVKRLGYFNLYDHDTSTLQTDRQMDGQTDEQLAMPIPRSAMLRAVKIQLTQMQMSSIHGQLLQYLHNNIQQRLSLHLYYEEATVTADLAS